MDNYEETSPEQSGNSDETPTLSDIIRVLGELVLMRTLSPRFAEQQAIAVELERDDLAHEQRMELIRMQGKSCNKDSAHILAVTFVTAVAVTVIYVTYGNANNRNA